MAPIRSAKARAWLRNFRKKDIRFRAASPVATAWRFVPSVNEHSHFVGAAIVSQVRFVQLHPTGAMHASERLEALMADGGIDDCDNAQNCVKVCPKGIPLTESLAAINGQVLRHAIRSWLQG